MDPKLELVKTWLDKARRDLASAERLAAGADPLLDTAIYHCQQAAEKALKGWLTFYDLRFEKTHDLRLLVALAATKNSIFSRLQSYAELLTPYATAFRYPGEPLQPDKPEYDEAYNAASFVYDFVCSKLPLEVEGESIRDDPTGE